MDVLIGVLFLCVVILVPIGIVAYVLYGDA